MTDFLHLILGLLGLWLGAELVVRGATGLARRFGLSELFIGLTVLSIGSDLPELAVAVGAGLRALGGEDVSGIVIGSSIGSAFGQIGLVLGISGLVGFIALPKGQVYRHAAALLGSIALLYIVAADGAVSRWEGGLLLVAFTTYLVFLWHFEQSSVTGQNPPQLHATRPLLRIVAGMGVLAMSSDMTVSASTDVATTLGLDQTVIAIIVIGLGTSLPELTISVGALLKRRPGLSIGNLVGSNVLDVLAPVGIAASIVPLRVESTVLSFDLPALFGLSSVVLFFLWYRRGLQRREALIVIALYCFYLLSKIT